MEVAVFDTYVKKRAGGYMHFDIIVTKETSFEKVLFFGNAWLQSKWPGAPAVLPKDCRFCHLTAVIPRWEKQIQQLGYFIHELEGCH
ncbi:DUF2024 family protein [Chitinophaga nivalis]|uniref:DUF2024 family protein n=1 Tax=Chitinophaga nivalis TaxID=2991709 RepID=A0ABT3IUL3_9BACT|nr:DUF2024 family protein [Chitinophaga nivalis]MCW3462659.1 DUF2024 family protein [Chitinophaga nivalis]MCW3487650.1 DUF2024 family protein [Chitinophaga nivalis]